MLDPNARGRAGVKTLLAGAVLLLIAGAGLTYLGIDWARHGCRCDEPLYPDWAWVVLVALAAASFVAAAGLVVRGVRRR